MVKTWIPGGVVGTGTPTVALLAKAKDGTRDVSRFTAVSTAPGLALNSVRGMTAVELVP
jgi:hypothetical protein